MTTRTSAACQAPQQMKQIGWGLAASMRPKQAALHQTEEGGSKVILVHSKVIRDLAAELPGNLKIHCRHLYVV